LALLVIGGLLWQSVRSHIVPFIVEVDAEGEVKGLGPVSEHYAVSDGQIAHGLERFIRDVRSVPLDPIVLRDDWLEAYDFTTARGALALNEYARVNDPFSHVGQSSVAVDVTSLVRASKDSFQVRWIERKYTNGALAGTEQWTAIVTLEIRPPRDEAHLRKNPLGLFVDALNWSRELGASTK
jgi:type IV secretion system protein TrbF